MFDLFIAVNEVNSKHSQISRSLINIQGKIFIFKEFEMPLKRQFKFQHSQGPARAPCPFDQFS